MTEHRNIKDYCACGESLICKASFRAAEKRAGDAERERDEARAALGGERLSRRQAEAGIENQRGRANGFRKAADQALSALSASQDLVRRLGGMFSQIIRESGSRAAWEIAQQALALADSPAPPSLSEPQHVCGLSGYNGMIDPPCPGPGHRYVPAAPPLPEEESPCPCVKAHVAEYGCPCDCHTEAF